MGHALNEIDEYAAGMDQLTDAVLALRKRGTRIWNRAGRSDPPLTLAEIRKMRLALRRLQIAARS